MSEEILRKVQDILYSKLGKVVADSTIRVNCQRMGIKQEDLSKENLTLFAENIKVSLMLFLGDKEIKELLEDIKKID